MSDVTVGTLIDESAGRDAIHIAIAPAVAAHTLVAGQDIGFVDEVGLGLVGKVSDPIGIVDPFLKDPVFAGQRFWLFLYPRTITSLRHVWTHPAFAEETATRPKNGNKQASEDWLRNFIARSDCPEYDRLIAAVNAGGNWQRSDDDDYYAIRIEDEYLHVNGWDAHGEIPSEFWDHIEVVTGRKMTKRPTYFSCSC
jgi:hypothetical protein